MAKPGSERAAASLRLAPMFLLLGLLPFVAVEHAARATTATFTAVADTYSRSDVPTGNYGTSGRFSAQNGSQVRVAYLRFNVQLPPGTSVTGATLVVYAISAGTAVPVELHRVTDTTWGETTLTWANAPAVGALVSSANTYMNKTSVSFPAASLVDGSGLVSMALVTASTAYHGWSSREASSNRPQLLVETTTTSSTGATTTTTTGATTTTMAATTTTTGATSTTTAPPSAGDPVIVAAGDIACPGLCGQGQTAALVDSINPTAVLGLGDYQYEEGTLANLAAFYDPYWGRFKAKTWPAVGGSHDFYGTGDFLTYFNNGRPVPLAPEGSYSFDIGSWHFIALNSFCFPSATCDENAVTAWLRADLAAHPNLCTAAYFHEPYWTSPSNHARNLHLKPWIDALYDAGADVVLQAHNHFYERFAPQTPGDVRDDGRGLTAFVVGTGGRSHYAPTATAANSLAGNADTYGVLKMTLHPSGFDFQFVPVAGRAFTDSGTGACH